VDVGGFQTIPAHPPFLPLCEINAEKNIFNKTEVHTIKTSFTAFETFRVTVSTLYKIFNSDGKKIKTMSIKYLCFVLAALVLEL
jgi:hypothetical protein